MSNFVSCANLPADLLAVLKKYGMPEHCTEFAITGKGPDRVLEFSFTCYARMPKDGETFDDVTETRKFKLVETT